MSLGAQKASKMERTLGQIAQSGAIAGEINFQQAISAGAGAASTQSLPAPAIVPRFAGQMAVEGGMTVTCSTSVIVTFALKRGSTIIQQRRVTSDATNGLASATFAMLDPVLQTGSVVYSILATPATGNAAIAANEGNVTVVEEGA